MRKQSLSLIQVLYLLILLNFTYCKTTSSSKLKITEKSKMFLTNHITKCNRNIKTMFKACPEIFKPVCGYYKNCNGIGKTFSNSCLACSDKKIQYYTEGKCKIKKSHKKIKYNKCSPESRIGQFCILLYKPVCGITAKCKHNISKCHTYSNSCFACHDKSVLYYKDGPCIPINEEKIPGDTDIDPIVLYPIDPIIEPDQFKNRFLCEKRTTECIWQEYFPVCGFKKGCDFKRDICMETFNNACEACMMEKIIEYSTGECPKSHACTDDMRNQACTEEYIGRCGMEYGCNPKSPDTCNNNFGTGCQACTNPEIEKYYDYECGELAAQSDKTIDPYVDTCEKYCCLDEDRNKICTEEYLGVCAHKSEDCITDCQYTTGTYCQACQNPEVTWVEKGECE